MKIPIRVLIIEDNEDDTILEIDALIRGGFTIDYERIETREALSLALHEKTWDCIISDYAMPRFSGLEALDGTQIPAPYRAGSPPCESPHSR